MTKAEYVLRRLVLALVVLTGVSIATFVIARLVPSDPAAKWVGPRARPEQIEAARTELGLDRPLYEQYLIYLGQIAAGDFGISVRTRQPIIQDLRVYLPATLELVLASMVLTILIGIPLGVVSGVWRDSLVDHTSRLFAVTSVSTPVFWLALILQLFFVQQLGWLPLGGRVSREITLFAPIQHITGFYLIDSAVTGNWSAFRDALVHLILPGCTLAAYGTGLSVRMTRANMVEVMEQPFITAARAAGLGSGTIYFRLALKNAVVPTLMVLGMNFVLQLTGSVLVEVVFLWPGLGTYLTGAILDIDFPVIVSVALVVTILCVLTNLLLDLVQAMIDPRVSLE